MHWICPLYKLSTCWAQQVERIWTPCWEMLSLVEANLKLVKLFAQHCSTFPLFRSHPCVAQQSREHLHSNAQHVEPTHAQCPAYPRILSHDSAWAFVKSSDCSTCWVIVEVIWTPRSTNTQRVESLYSGQIQCICTQPYAQLQNRSLHVVDDETCREMYRRRNKHVQSVQKYLLSLLNMQICDVFVDVVVVVA